MISDAVALERRLDATIQEVRHAMTAPDQLAGWLGRGLLEPFEGGSVELITGGHDGGRVVGVVRRFTPPRLLELSWRLEGEPETVLRFELEQERDQTLLRLAHTDLPAKLLDDYQRGWTAYADAIARHLTMQRQSQHPI